ncbi:ABC transporter permease [Hyphomonas oceanitis]|uniref:ABC transporter permease n=1 Tax=Hyphomonas oceanitis SCH89 TaxID=1280953 RepID=A0A059G3E9_9PROT|nr:ABC transporter permease [Hyphomonas oceanitis]KDA00993.1 ABC transporter permease [Hyphomonas oceanitis SCH89]|tara:strand:+ start:1497 stop:2633 length:1137 start_codon:yes stop_codon:yes gene_type:complete
MTGYRLPAPLRRSLTLARKETFQIVRDPSSILIAFILPLILLLLFGFGISLDANSIRIGVVVQDARADARTLVQAFEASDYFEIVTAFDQTALEPDLVSGDLRGLVVIPPDFSERLRARDPAPIEVLTDGSQPNTAQFVANYAQGVYGVWQTRHLGDAALTPPAAITPQPRFWFNAELTSRYNLVPGSTAVVMTIIGTLLTALVIAREWERGTMEAVLATPVSRVELLLSKIVPYFLLGMSSLVLCAVAAVFIFDVPFRGSVLALVAVAAAFLVPALGQGLLISAATKNQFVAAQLALFTGFLPATLLSGFIFEISAMPLPIRTVTTVIPARYFVTSLQTLFLAGDVWSVLLPAIAKMLAVGVFFLALTWLATPKRIA